MLDGQYYHIYLNEPSDGDWHTICRNLKQDLLNGTGKTLDHIASFCIRGNLALDNLVFYSSPQTMKYGYTGKEQDGSDLIYFGARYYDPEMGRFMSVDPVGAGDNWYAYCNDNPVSMLILRGWIGFI
jgi:RHS repeat-associated protein